MRAWMSVVALVLATGFAGCGGSASNPSNPTPSAQMSPLAGTWVGTASDSSGATMGMSTGTGMGMGMAGGSMGDMTWQMTQTGSTFKGAVGFSGYHGGGQMTVSGTMNGKSGTFTMTMPNGTMPMAGCSGQVNGTFDMDDRMVQMHGTYTGSTTCSGPFDHGQMTMNKR